MLAHVIVHAKRVANLGLVGVCVFVTYRRGNELPLIETESAPDGVKQWRLADAGECAASAIMHGAILADRLQKAFRAAWDGGPL